MVNSKVIQYLATVIALHFTLVSHWVIKSVGRVSDQCNFEACELVKRKTELRACQDLLNEWVCWLSAGFRSTDHQQWPVCSKMSSESVLQNLLRSVTSKRVSECASMWNHCAQCWKLILIFYWLQDTALRDMVLLTLSKHYVMMIFMINLAHFWLFFCILDLLMSFSQSMIADYVTKCLLTIINTIIIITRPGWIVGREKFSLVNFSRLASRLRRAAQNFGFAFYI